MGRRRTTPPVKNRSRKREDGRPCGTLKRFSFEQTRLGFMLCYEMPVVYRMLRRLCPAGTRFEPDWQVVDAVARLSGDSSYLKPKFRRYLEEYARTGVYCRRGKRITPSRREYYRNLCRRKMEEYIRRNRKRL